MIDIRLVRDDRAAVVAALARRGVDPSEVEELARLDAEHREAIAAAETLRAEVKALSRRVGEAKRAKDEAAAAAAAEDSRRLGEEEREASARADELGERVRGVLLDLPNLPSEDAPDGADPDDNVEVRRWWPGADEGTPEPVPAEHQRVPHWEIGESLHMLRMDLGARLSGSMFPLFAGDGARLLRALTAFALDRNTAPSPSAGSPGFIELRPPTLVLRDTMISTGHLPKFIDDAYEIGRDDLWPIPTSEVPMTSLFRGEILDEAMLPLRFTAATACYRRESGAAGRDTRGLLRVHEFDKVELFAYATPEQASSLHADILDRAESMLRELGFTYRVLDLCTGDLGGPSARTFDLEVFAPGSDRWLEVSSVSWYRDYQARRANVRYRPAGGGAPALVHTLNGSALAWPRIWAALVEWGRQPDGTVRLPECLGAYLGGRLELGASNR
jgi:seryl-tRNA synthetase